MNKNKKGFTLIELLVVVAVIGLLSSIILVYLGPAREKARDAQRKTDTRQINTAMEMCYDDASCNARESYIDTAAGVAAGTVIGTYLTVPTDTLNTGDQIYKWTDGTSQYYCFYVQLESADNTWLCSSNKGVKENVQVAAPTNATCCGLNVAN